MSIGWVALRSDFCTHATGVRVKRGSVEADGRLDVRHRTRLWTRGAGARLDVERQEGAKPKMALRKYRTATAP